MVQPYLPIATAILALNTASTFAAPLQYETRTNHHAPVGHSLLEALDSDRLKNSPGPQSFSRRTVPTPDQSGSSGSHAQQTLHSFIYGSSSNPPSPSPSSSGRKDEDWSDISLDHGPSHQPSTAPSIVPKKPTFFQKMRKGAVHDITTTPIMLGLTALAASASIASVYKSYNPRRDVDEPEDSSYGRKLVPDKLD